MAFGFVVVFVFGCATGAVVSHSVAPPARANTANLAEWEYVCIEVEHGELMRAANKLGTGGWEMVGGVPPAAGRNPMNEPEYVWCFKRRKE
jgi:hypothetical protein